MAYGVTPTHAWRTRSCTIVSSVMSPREAFGPNLRRLRIQRGISLHQIAAETKVSADLWDGLEHNNFDRWPGGIFARAYVREYARLIGADPEATDYLTMFDVNVRRLAEALAP